MSTNADIIFDSLESHPLQNLTIVQLKKELRFRNLSLTGNKNDLMLRIVEDNIKRKNEGTLDELNTLRMQYFNDEETPSDRNLLMEIESLRKQGEIIENALEWLKEVERISTLANWSDELKLTNAISRLSGSAKNWQLTTGKNINDWITWKTALASRFKRRITMQEFLAHQSDRKLKHNESLVDYIYSKDALLEKAPFTIPQPDRISMIIGDITDEKWQIALATQNSNTVEELIDRATALDAIRSAKQEHKKHSTKSQIRPSYTYDEQRRKYNPITDDIRDITCWRCGIKGHAPFMCSLPPPPRGSTIAQPRNTSRQNQYSNSQTSAQFPSSSSLTSSNNHALVETTSLNSSNSRRNNNNRNSTSGRSTTANNPSINCIRTQTNRRALIPVIINNDTEIQALCDPCADITVIQESCVPSDTVIHPWNDGQFQVVDHEIKPIGWISLNIIVGNVEHMMPKIGICTQLPFKLILGFDWQQQVQARCTYDPNGSLCISTPTSFHLYECIHASKPSINCVALNQPLLDDVTLPEATSNIVSSETNLILKSAGLSTTQQAQLDAVIGKFTDVIYANDDNIGLCPYVEFKIELQHEKPIRCRPYRLSEPDPHFLKTQIQKWLKQGICRPSNSPYAAPAFIVDQPFHESTTRRVAVDFSRTINSITKIDPHPIDQMEDAIKHTADAAEENIKLEPCIEFNQPIVTQNSPFRIPKCKQFRRVARKIRWKRGKRRTLWSGVKRRLKEKSKLRPGLQKLEWKRVKKRLHKEWKMRRTSLVQWVDRFFGSEDQLDLLTLARAEAANNVYETHLENKQRFDLHRRSHSFTAGDLVLYDWPKKGDHKLSPIFKGSFVIVRPVGAVCYEIKSTTQQNKFIKVVHLQHLRPYFKRNTPTIKENTTDEETERY
ncbi:putative gypsy-29-i dr [Nephila pilipes]|uniref:Putative gypsy-29-i dr n=1 Tax=Nephila pilipes TaxID=299642 RepID=A0A8X6U049_NEPPI|nr:putative gypsy-29-i dr [Nephila pilipes]